MNAPGVIAMSIPEYDAWQRGIRTDRRIAMIERIGDGIERAMPAIAVLLAVLIAWAVMA